MRSVAIFGSLFIMWFVYSGFVKPQFLIMGFVSCALAFWISKRMGVIEGEKMPIYWRAGSILYVGWLMKEIVVSSVHVAITIWQVKPKISPALKWVRTEPTSDVNKALYANSITLTPGTVCVNVEKKRMLVHALDVDSIADLKEGEMERYAAHVTGEVKA